MFEHFVHLLESSNEYSFFLASIIAFAWGLFSVILCPCHLAIIPLVIGLITRQGKTLRIRDAFFACAMLSLGILGSTTLMITLLFTLFWGLFSHTFTAMMYYVVALVFFYLGFKFLDLLPRFLSPQFSLKPNQNIIKNTCFLGLFLGIVLAPCTLGFALPIISTAFDPKSTLFTGFFLLSMFALGNIILIILSGTFIEFVQRYLNWNQNAMSARIIKYICGAILIFEGFYALYLA